MTIKRIKRLKTQQTENQRSPRVGSLYQLQGRRGAPDNIKTQNMAGSIRRPQSCAFNARQTQLAGDLDDACNPISLRFLLCQFGTPKMIIQRGDAFARNGQSAAHGIDCYTATPPRLRRPRLGPSERWERTSRSIGSSLSLSV